MGGALNHYAEGSYVPWRAMSYNLGKDFNALDYVIDEQKPYVYIFRDGKFVKQYEGEECSEIYESILDFPTYNKNGELLSLYTPENVSMYFDTIKEHWEVMHMLNIRAKSIQTILNRAFQAKLILPDEFNEAQIDIDWLKKRVAELYIKRRESDFYAMFDADDIYFSYYGAYLELVHDNKYDGLKREALMQEAKCFVLNHNVSLDMYFSWNETPEEDRGWIKETDEFILNWRVT
jgi:hypothetical protein